MKVVLLLCLYSVVALAGDSKVRPIPQPYPIPIKATQIFPFESASPPRRATHTILIPQPPPIGPLRPVTLPKLSRRKMSTGKKPKEQPSFFETFGKKFDWLTSLNADPTTPTPKRRKIPNHRRKLRKRPNGHRRRPEHQEDHYKTFNPPKDYDSYNPSKKHYEEYNPPREEYSNYDNDYDVYDYDDGTNRDDEYTDDVVLPELDAYLIPQKDVYSRRPPNMYSYPEHKSYSADPVYEQEPYDYHYPHDDRPSKKINPITLLVAPLASIAFLATAAAVFSNPVLFNFSNVGSIRRKRRQVSEQDNDVYANLDDETLKSIHEVQVLEKFLGKLPEETRSQDELMSMFLKCAGYLEEGNYCLDRVVCEYGNGKSTLEQEDKDVISIILYDIMSNKYLGKEYKDRLRTAARYGRDNNECLKFNCPTLVGKL